MFKRLLKKCIFLVAILTSVSLISNAISLYDLQHSNQYKLVYSTNTQDLYMNLSSVQSLRYSPDIPPAFNTQNETLPIFTNFTKDGYADFIANYNYNYSIEGIAQKQRLYELSFNEAKLYLISAKRKEPGITGSFKLDKVYDLDGRIDIDFSILDDNNYTTADYVYAGPFYKAAAYAFEKAYNKIF